jgi:hypothetical protein
MSNPSAARDWDDAPEERFQRACSGADQPRNLARAFAVGGDF